MNGGRGTVAPVMAKSMLARLLEHNNWANRKLIRACAALGDDELDAHPFSEAQWTIRENLVHLVHCQQAYLCILNRTIDDGLGPPPDFEDLETAADSSGDGLLTLDIEPLPSPIETRDGFRVEPWVVMLQAIHHATEHRKQIANLMRAEGLEPPRLDGWGYGDAEGAVAAPRES